MPNISVPQVEYIVGATPQETAALLNARIVELRFNNPTFERVDAGFWITYSKEIKETTIGERKAADDNHATHDGYPRCSECSYFEHVSDNVKWGRCSRYGDASVNRNRRVCTAYWNDTGGDELDA